MHISRRTFGIAASLGLAGLSVGLGAPAAVAAPPVVRGKERNHGNPVPGVPGDIPSEESDQGVIRSSGAYLTYFATAGTLSTAPRFFAMDLSGNMVATVQIPKGQAAWALAHNPVTRTVFLGTSANRTGYLYEWDGATLSLRATVEGQEIMDIAVAPDNGAVYFGTYVSGGTGRLWTYVDGRAQDLGGPMKGEAYVRAVAVDGSFVYVANQRSGGAKVVQINRGSNKHTQLSLPAKFAGATVAKDIRIAGDFVFFRVEDGNFLFAFNQATGKFVNLDDQVNRDRSKPDPRNMVPYITGISQRQLSPLLEGRYVYFQRANAGIMRIDTKDSLRTIQVDKFYPNTFTRTMVDASISGPSSYAWRPMPGRSGNSLVVTTNHGTVEAISYGTQAKTVRTVKGSTAASVIWSLGVDTANNVYAGGFDRPAGAGKFNTKTGETTVLDMLQVEGGGIFNSRVVAGGYNGRSDASSAPLYVYNGREQPRLTRHLGHRQERPVTFHQVGSQVAIGSIGIKGNKSDGLGYEGALSLWNPDTGDLKAYEGVIPNQSVISLGLHNGLIVGGSSNGLGTGGTIDQKARGTIFTFNPSTGKVVHSIKPAGFDSSTYSYVAAITPKPGTPGVFYAISTGNLIEFKVAGSGTIGSVRVIAPIGSNDASGRTLGIEVIDGILFVANGSLIDAVNPATGERTAVARSAGGAAPRCLRRIGKTLFYSRDTTLYSYEVTSASAANDLAAPQLTHPAPGSTVPPGSYTLKGTGTANAKIVVTDDVDRSRSTTVAADGTWTLSSPFPLSVHRYTFTITASMAGFEDQRSSFTVEVSNSSSPFVDVRAGVEHYDAMLWMGTRGISTGWKTSRGQEYRPLLPVNRDAMAAFLYRLAGSPAVSLPSRSPFRDMAPGREHYKAVIWAYNKKITTGWTVSGGREFRPTTPINRDAMAAFLYRFAGSPSYSAPASSGFRDVPRGMAFYKEMNWMRATGISTGWGDRTYRPLQPVNRDAMAAFLYRVDQKF